jgi:hypothetical protein
LDDMSMRKVGWIACAVGLLAVSCKDDGAGDPQTADTTGASTDGDDEDDDGNASNDDSDDADPTTNPSGPSTDPDDTGPSTDPTADPDATGPADSSTGEPGDPIDPEALDDDFDDGIDGWTALNENLASIVVDAGALHIQPAEWTVWVDDSTSTFLHKTVTGNFKVTAAVTARGVQNPGAPPPPVYRFGGIMARNPGGGAENHVFIVLGTDEDPSVETKNTVSSSSQYEGPSWPSASGEIRICRFGDTFELYVRTAGGAWELSNSFERPDLPDELQVGPIAYNYDEAANLDARFEFVDFEPVAGPDECAQ